MRIADRYLMRSVAVGLLLAAAVLVPLFSFVDLVDQLDDVGKGSYRAVDALIYVGMTLPRRLIELGPFIALLGTIVAIGSLASHRELTALRAAGVSAGRIGLAALYAGVAFIVLLVAVDQFIAAPLQQQAISMRARATAADSAELSTGSSLWARHGDRMLRIGSMRHGRIPEQVEIFRFDGGGRLAHYIYADHADIRGGGVWRLHGVVQKGFPAGAPTTERRSVMSWQTFLTPSQIKLLQKPAQSLSPVDLYQYVNYLRRSGQRTAEYALALWQKLGQLILTAAMILLAVPFGFGSARSAGMGSRLALGAVVGLGVYLVDQIAANAGLLLNISIPLVALGPSVILLAIAVTAVRRIR